VRHYNYVPALERAGFRVAVAPFLDDEYLRRLYRGQRPGLRLLAKAYWRRLRQILSARRYDLIWIEKEALPWLPAVVERAFLGRGPVVMDFDDPWHLHYANHRQFLVRALLGRKLEAVASHACAVTTGSPVLTAWARSAEASRVIEMPPAVDIEQYPVRPLPDGTFTIGWIGTPGNETYLEFIAEPLRHLHAAHGARLRVIGGSGRFSLPGVAIDNVPWNEATEAEELARCHVGVMPLRDGPWERGKCGYKIIQYMAAGRPAVASDVGAASSILAHGKTGFLAQTAEEWIAALAQLATDRERLRTMGLAARQQAEAKYSLQNDAKRLVEILLRAVGGPATTKCRAASGTPPSFTLHNILLDDGTETKPDTVRISHTPWFLSAKRCLNALYPQGFSGLRIADLACLEGGYTVEFARMGFAEALGIEIRRSNFANCMFIKGRLNLPNLTFVNDDVWNLERYGVFDVIFCGGILYHLDEPKRFLALMSRLARKAVLINTHFSTVTPIAAHSLSEMTQNEGLPGRWYDEPGAGYDDMKWSAWDNRRSFWIQREYLIQAIRDAGFPMVFEQYDCLGDDIAASMTLGYYRAENRCTFVGVKV
jgi:glycosyltransferase involved in cell wall biosynthesis